jgi:putative ABC transport system permease protein
MLLLAAAVCVLLTACANAANLLLARAARRRGEISLRAALGASRLRIIAQLLVECSLLSTLAAALGLLLAIGLVRVFTIEAIPLNLPYWVRFEFDARVFAYVAALCLGTGVLFALAPAWQLSNTSAGDILKDSGRQPLGSARTRRSAHVLLLAELALTMVLLAVASLLVRSARTLYEADAILFAPQVMTAQIALPSPKYATPAERRAFRDRLAEHLATAPSLTSAALASARPFVDSISMQLLLEGETPSPEGGRVVQTIAIGDRYFETLGLRMVRGRPLEAQDAVAGPDAVVINERFATLHFPGADPVGRRIRLAELGPKETPGPWLTIVGVAPSVRQRPMGPAAAIAYLPLRTDTGTFTAVVARASGDATLAAAAIRDQLRAVEPDAAAYNLESLERLSEKSRWTHRMLSMVITLFAAIALLLSATGLYALTAYGVSQRTAEVGLRMALGAQRAQVAWLFIRGMLWPVGVGLGVGLAAAFAVGRLIRGLLVETSPTDPRIFAGISALLIATVIAASIIPVRRAARMDAAQALRRD